EFLKDIYGRMIHPKAYLTLKGVAHYCGTADLCGFIIYDKKAVDELVTAIDSFLSKDIRGF
ncbi:MAG: hypothetical protein ABIA63_12765, partial [bacterium]